MTGRFLLRVEAHPDQPLDRHRWPGTLPSVQALLDGWEAPAGLTVLVGENGSGKSTLVEALAAAVGLNPQGGSRGLHETFARQTEAQVPLEARWAVGGRPWSYFARAETMHTLYSYLEDNPGRGGEVAFHRRSHGEGFLAILDSRLSERGLYLLDEPDAPLSFQSQLGLVSMLMELVAAGSQIIVATHSPLVAATPDATILELGEWGLRRAVWEELDLVDLWRAFLEEPDLFLRHLRDDA